MLSKEEKSKIIDDFKMLGQRKGLLKYLYNTDIEKYRELIDRLNIRG